jgi:hypothetical protein
MTASSFCTSLYGRFDYEDTVFHYAAADRLDCVVIHSTARAAAADPIGAQ